MFVCIDIRDEMVYGPFNTRAQAAKWKDIDYEHRMGMSVTEVESVVGAAGLIAEHFPDVRMCPWFEYGRSCIRSEAHGGDHDYPV